MLVLNQFWLQSWLQGATIDVDDAHEFLLKQGFETEACEKLHTKDIVVGQIKQVQPHPDADRLNVCQVDVGQSEYLSIVCGCPSVRAGLKVAVACVGVDLGVFRIEKRKLRGVDSCGMLCSMSELGFKSSQQGIWHLSSDAPVGMALNQWLQRGEMRYGIELTPNRGDCLSLRGMAREFSIGMGCDLQMPWTGSDTLQKLPSRGEIAVSADAKAHLQSFYILRLVREDVHTLYVTPDWMKVRLLEAGFALHHVVVDVLNYVMLETGQPFHAYGGHLSDHFSLSMGSGEKLSLLNGEEAALDKHTLVVRNDGTPVCIAGYMGGESSASCEGDEAIYLEAAAFKSETIAYHCRRYQHHTQSGSRFERGIDFDFTALALERALQLLVDYAGYVPRYQLSYVTKDDTAAVELQLTDRFASKILGVDVSSDEVISALQRSGCVGRLVDDEMIFSIPSWRNDLRYPECVVSEFVRLSGLPDFSEAPLSAVLPKGVAAFEHVEWVHAQMHACLTGWGFNETYSLSFDNEAEASVFVADKNALVLLENPISHSLQVMRPSLFSGLLRQVKRNLAKQEHDVKLYEVGKCFVRVDGVLQESSTLAMVFTGRTMPENWLLQSTFTFHHAKSSVLALLRKVLGSSLDLTWVAEAVDGMHPYQSGKFYVGDYPVAACGLLHPAVAKKQKLSSQIYFVSVDLDWLDKQNLCDRYAPVSDQPTMRRDISLLVPSEISYAQIKSEIQSSVFQYLKKIVIFDAYEGTQVPDGFYGLSVGLLFQDEAKTLQDEDLSPMLENLIKKLDEQLKIKPRGGSFNGNTNKS